MPIAVEYVDGKKHFSVLENNPTVLNALSSSLGLSSDLEFIDIYTLPWISSRPTFALLAIIPMTPVWHLTRTLEDSSMSTTDSLPENASNPVLWFKQTIGHACGSIGLLHCALNGPAEQYIIADGTLAKIRKAAIPLGTADRAQMLYDSKALEEAHQAAAELGDTEPMNAAEGDRTGNHFVAFVIHQGRMWELEGGRKGPLDRGSVEDGEDLLSERLVAKGIGKVIDDEREKGSGVLRFSLMALVKRENVD